MLALDLRLLLSSCLCLVPSPRPNACHKRHRACKANLRPALLGAAAMLQMWVCPEQHGTITAVFKNQIDWVPLELGSVRPTQGRTLAIAQVNLRRSAATCAYTRLCIAPVGVAG